MLPVMTSRKCQSITDSSDISPWLEGKKVETTQPWMRWERF